MEKEIKQIVIQCDFCDRDSISHILDKCFSCGKDICLNHTTNISFNVDEVVYLCPECSNSLTVDEVKKKYESRI